MDWEKIYTVLLRRNWMTPLILSSFSYFFFSGALTLGVILGGFLVMVNFDVMQQTIRRAFPLTGSEKGGKTALIAKSYLRLLVLSALIFGLLKSGLVDPVGLAFGLSTVVISIVSLGIGRAWEGGTGEAV